ncbi:carboxypeptidase-like regulatory domain-containing protein [Frigoriglobus tundricola]|uniref:carboxypeptidase-like regulatory domain-containing protein n=1 Tax=Frigoriglobus tundricola TaxID=2774151 RepID=UPI00148EC07E|nr:carboxypeptidase-like regulatory domain-containing protein [Frigoriglobus tundricola]
MALLAIALASTGCGDSDSGRVSGKVRLNDAPVPAGTVTFHGENNRSASALLDADGTYTATGVPLGAVKVTVTTPAQMGEKAKKALEKARNVSIQGRSDAVEIPARYGRPEQSGLQLTVTSGRQTFDIDLVPESPGADGTREGRKNGPRK